jgi:chromosome segregation ATPase
MTDLPQIYQAIGDLTARVGILASEQARSRDGVERLDEKIDDLRRGQSVALRTLQDMATRVDEHETHIEDYRTVRRFGGIVVTAVGALAGMLGYFGEALAHKLGLK